MNTTALPYVIQYIVREWQKSSALRIVSVTLVIAALSLVSIHPKFTVVAQDQNGDRQTNYNQPVGGEINDDQPQAVWVFNTRAKNDRISITVDRLNGTLIPTVQLIDDHGNALISAEADITFAHATVREFFMPTMGEYHVVVSRLNGKGGKTNGKYRLVVALLGVGEDFLAPLILEGEVKVGVPRKGSLTNVRWQDTWAIKLDTVNPLTINVTRTSDTLVPIIKLLDTNMHELATAAADDTFATATINNFTPPSPGQYLLVVYRLGRTTGGTTGEYQISATQTQK